jgi:hypothetical protein
MANPVADAEGSELGKITVVENENKMAGLVPQALAKLFPITFASDFSSSNLNVGRSLPEVGGSGTLFMKLGSPPSAQRGSICAAVKPAAISAAPFRKSRRCEFNMTAPLK